MADIVSAEVRSRMMSGIRSKNTKPELILRKALHARGFRFRIHPPKLPGKPDLVFPRYRAAIFVNGCFWHGHDCHLYRLPGTRSDFWRAKINANKNRDALNIQELLSLKWRVSVIWECTLKSKSRLPLEQVIEECANWLRSGEPGFDLRSV